MVGVHRWDRGPASADAGPGGARDGSVKSVERAIDILLCLDNGPLTLSEVSAQVRMSKTTVLRLLSALGHGGLVVRNPLNKSYDLGPGCLRLGQAFISGGGGFDAFASGPLRTLWTRTGETVAVHVRLGRQRVCVVEIPSRQELRYVSGIGTAAPIHLGSAGRALLAFMSAEDVTKLLGDVASDPVASGPVIDQGSFREELDRVRQQGYALSEGERVPGAAAVSVPVFGDDGVIAALSVLGPAARFTHSDRLIAVEDLKQAASEMHEALRQNEPRVDRRSSS